MSGKTLFCYLRRVEIKLYTLHSKTYLFQQIYEAQLCVELKSGQIDVNILIFLVNHFILKKSVKY